MFYLILCLLLIVTAWTGVAKAAVDRLEILERHLVAEGAAFGASGAYEKIRGRAWFALDPHAAANAAIADLVLAPRDVRGLVTFDAEFLMLRPAEPARGNGTLLYEVNNRGNIAILAQLDAAPGGNDPSTAADFGNAFLLQQGFTLLWSAWTWDVIADVHECRAAPELGRIEGFGYATLRRRHALSRDSSRKVTRFVFGAQPPCRLAMADADTRARNWPGQDQKGRQTGRRSPKVG